MKSAYSLVSEEDKYITNSLQFDVGVNLEFCGNIKQENPNQREEEKSLKEFLSKTVLGLIYEGPEEVD